MTNKEILGELKRCWEYLNDIDYNGNAQHFDGQLNGEQIAHVNNAMNHIAEVYNTFRETLDDKETQVMIDDELFHIGKYVSEDYSEKYDEEEHYTYWTTCADVNFYWYENYDFLTSDTDELYKVNTDELYNVNTEV